MMKGADLHPKDHSIQLFTDTSNEEQASTQSLWSDKEKRLHISSRVEGGLPGPSKYLGPVTKPNSVGYYNNSTVVAYINKQWGTHLAEMCTLLWKIMT